MATLIDSYSESNASGYNGNIQSGSENVNERGQSFTTGAAASIGSAKFYVKKVGSPTGSVYARLWSHSGTYGTSSVGGSLLATSDAYDVSTISTSLGLVTFTFSGAEQYAMSATTNYVICAFYNGGTPGSDYVSVEADNTSPTHGGNASYHILANPVSSYWAYLSAYDIPFYVYDNAASPTTISVSDTTTVTENINISQVYNMPSNVSLVRGVKIIG